MKKWLRMIIPFLLVSSLAFAQTPSISQITQPISNIYDLIKAAVSILGIIAITIAGAMYMFSGGNIQQRESAKSTVSYAVVGLVLVWVAPLIVSYLTVP
jgi:RsiW-degrading membrane proteinase PrsW (M82 family)